MEKENDLRNPLSIIKKSSRLPTLFIGAGISKRYTKNYPNWKDLLKNLAKEIGYNDTQYHAIVQKINAENINNSNGFFYQCMASELEKALNDKILHEKIDVNKLFSDSEIKEIKDNNLSFFKKLIAKQFEKLEITEDVNMISEMAKFKLSCEKVSSIFTTNYDLFLESQILEGFKVYSYQEALYLRNNDGYGEMFKIHGSIDDIKNIVITKEDYIRFNNNLKLFASKLMSILTEFPIIFIGYSFEDSNIIAIFEDFINCFDDEKLKEIQKYLIYMAYDPKITKPIFGEKRFGKNRTITLSTIQTNDFSILYDAINELTPTASTVEIRKYRSMFAKLVREYGYGKKTIKVIGVENISELNDTNVAIAFGAEQIINNFNNIIATDGIIGKTPNNIIIFCLFRNDIPFDDIVTRYFDINAIQKGHYLPVYHLRNNMTCSYNQTGIRFRENLEYKDSKYDEFLTCINKEQIISTNNIDEKINEYLSDGKFNSTDFSHLINSIYKTYVNGNIDKEQMIKYLQKCYEKSKEVIKVTQFKKVICYMDKD